MDRDAIKGLYMDTLSNGIMSKKGGAGLGFITMSLKSNHTIGHESIQVSDDLVFFTQNVMIDRVKK